NRRVQLAALGKQRANIVQRVRQTVVQLQGSPVMRFGLIVAPRCFENGCVGVVSLRRSWFECQPAATARLGLFVLPQRAEGETEVTVRVGIGGYAFNCAQQERFCLDVSATQETNSTQLVECRDMARVVIENRSKGRLRFSFATRVEKFDRVDVALLECQFYPGQPIRTMLIAPNGECVPDQFYRAVPIARRRLPEEAQGRIPRAVGAFDQPSPVRHERQENPTRPAQSSRKMRYRSIDRDNQIQIEQSCRRLGKVRQLRSNVDELAFDLPKSLSFSLLQRIETDSKLLEQGGEASWFNRT